MVTADFIGEVRSIARTAGVECHILGASGGRRSRIPPFIQHSVGQKLGVSSNPAFERGWIRQSPKGDVANALIMPRRGTQELDPYSAGIFALIGFSLDN